MNEGNYRRWRPDRWDEFVDKTHASFGWEERRTEREDGSYKVDFVYVGEDDAYHMAAPFDQCCSYVYFIHAPELKRVKIGVSTNVQQRLSELQVSAPCQLRLLKLIPGDRQLEERIHDRFRRYRHRGEWFDEAVLDLWVREGPTTLRRAA